MKAPYYVYSTTMSLENQGVFSVPEKSGFSKNSDVSQLVKIGPFLKSLLKIYVYLTNYNLLNKHSG